jgi:HEAT repeat protein
LENIVADDIETDVQRQALFALARNQDREGVDRLIRIAKTHPNPHIRKQAVQCLGQSEDSRALDALIEIVRK